jgi:hypothetical protein
MPSVRVARGLVEVADQLGGSRSGGGKPAQRVARDYVTKPVDTDELLGRMERWLSVS